jgi:molybdopterin-guanine dinucleotide biosynthesis protein A
VAQEAVVSKVVDTIILAGDRNASRSVLGKNKLFVQIAGMPLLVYVLRALEQVERIGNIKIIGPRDTIEKLLLEYRGQLSGDKIIEVLEQKDNAYQNFWSAFTRTVPGYYDGIEAVDQSIMDKQVLVLPTDMPFITRREINEFLDACVDQALDYCLGMTEEEHLRKFYATADKPGIEMTYLHLREGSYRINNLHLIKPFRILNREYIEKIYERRYQKKFVNIAKMAYDFISTRGYGFKPLYLYAILELAILFRYYGISFMARQLKKLVSSADMSTYGGVILKTRIGIIETTLGGCAVDIDSDKDFVIAESMYQEWMARIEADNPESV